MSEASKRHNGLAGEVVKALVKPVIDADGSWSETMVLLESVVLGVVLFNERAFNVSRRASVETLETMTERVMTRLAEKDPQP